MSGTAIHQLVMQRRDFGYKGLRAPAVGWCDAAGCDWQTDGTATEVRDAFYQHLYTTEPRGSGGRR